MCIRDRVNSVAIFIQCMDQILGKEALEFATVYVDDILITSKTWNEHCDRIELVLRKFQQNNITLKLNKSKFITQELQFLGFIPVSYTHLLSLERSYLPLS